MANLRDLANRIRRNRNNLRMIRGILQEACNDHRFLHDALNVRQVVQHYVKDEPGFKSAPRDDRLVQDVGHILWMLHTGAHALPFVMPSWPTYFWEGLTLDSGDAFVHPEDLIDLRAEDLRRAYEEECQAMGTEPDEKRFVSFRRELINARGIWIESLAQLVEHYDDTIKRGSSKGGRRAEYDKEEDNEWALGWKQAKAAGMSKPAFARSLSITVSELDNCLDRVRSRES